jgi:hypothetical protein
MIQWDDDSHRWLMGRYPVLLVLLLCFYIKKLYQKVYEKINKKYEWIVHIIFYQPAKF